MGGGKGSTSYSERPLTDNEKALIDSQAKMNAQLSNTAKVADNRSAQSQADWEKYYKPTETGNTDQNTGLLASTIGANDSNQLALNGFLSGSKQNTNTNNSLNTLLALKSAHEAQQRADDYANDLKRSARETSGMISGEANKYSSFMDNINSQMGKADSDVLGRLRASNLSGLSTANESASRSLQAQLAQRGLINSGVGAKSLTDLNNNYMQQLGGAQANAYGQAVTNSDQMRMNQVSNNSNKLNGLVGAYGQMGQATQGALEKAYGATSGASASGNAAKGSAINNAYNNNNAQMGGALNAISSNNQQRTANLTNYAQLGRGMAGMSSNYLGQAGQMYGSAAQNAGSMFGTMGNLNNGYNQIQNQANQANSTAKGSSAGGVGQLAGSLGSAYLMGGMKK